MVGMAVGTEDGMILGIAAAGTGMDTDMVAVVTTDPTTTDTEAMLHQEPHQEKAAEILPVPTEVHHVMAPA